MDEPNGHEHAESTDTESVDTVILTNRLGICRYFPDDDLHPAGVYGYQGLHLIGTDGKSYLVVLTHEQALSLARELGPFIMQHGGGPDVG